MAVGLAFNALCRFNICSEVKTTVVPQQKKNLLHAHV